MKRPPILFFGLGALLLPILPSTHAQETNTVSAPMTLDQAIAQIGKLDQELREKVDKFRASLDKEVAAGQLPETAAQSLRYALKNAVVSLNSEYSLVFGTSRTPLDNATLQNELKVLETDWNTVQMRRLALLKTAATDMRTGITNALRTANKPTDLDPLIASVDRLQEAMPPRATTSTVSIVLGSTSFNYYVAFLRAFRQLLEVQKKPEPAALSSVLSQFQSAASNARNVAGDSEVQQRIQQAIAPYQKAQDDAQEALDQALRGGKPAAEVNAALAKLEEVVERNQQIRSSFSSRSVRDLSSALNTYRNYAAIVTALETEQFAQARISLNNARSSGTYNLGTARSAAFSEQLKTWEKAMDEGNQKVLAKRREEIQAKLAAIKKPADLEALAAELFKAESETRLGREPDFPRGFASQLNQLATAWSSATTVTALTRQTYSESPDQRLGADLSELRKRIERDVIARVSRVPEINQPPLADLPTEAALDRLSDQLAQKGEWRRLLQISEGRSGQPRFDGVIMGTNDLVTSLRAYLAAQNFELAEQWTDAVLSYKTVLRSTSERAPIKEAADRLKDLNKKHPEAFTPAPVSPSTPAARALPPP
jgi:hypothetical protein